MKKPALQPVTAADIARRLGVARPTVTTVLSNSKSNTRVSPELRERVLQMAAEMGYRPNAAARAMSSKRSKQIGVLVRITRRGEVIPSHGLETIMGINDVLEPSGNVMVVITLADEDREGLESRAFREHFLDGMILMDHIEEDDEDRVRNLIDHCVFVNTNHWRPVACIRRDELACGDLVVRQMHALGYRRILYVDREHGSHYSIIDRRAGVVRAAAELGIELKIVPTKIMMHADRPPPDLATIKPDTAVVVYDAYYARSLQGLFVERGQRPGTDFALACCDDAEEFAWTWPSLARMAFDRFDMGRQAAQMMLDRLANAEALPASRLLSSRWLPGRTARPRVDLVS